MDLNEVPSDILLLLQLLILGVHWKKNVYKGFLKIASLVKMLFYIYIYINVITSPRVPPYILEV